MYIHTHMDTLYIKTNNCVIKSKSAQYKYRVNYSIYKIDKSNTSKQPPVSCLDIIELTICNMSDTSDMLQAK